VRDQTLIQQFSIIAQQLQLLENSMRIGISGEAIRNEALTSLFIKKGLITQEEITSSIGDVIKKYQEQKKEEVEKKTTEIIVPTAKEVAEVQKSAGQETIPPPQQ
jgi:polyhydroxyalkanoate synthesis regulator phasin